MYVKMMFVALILSLSSSLAWSKPFVEIKTNKGTMLVELYPEKAPKTVENFLQYVSSKHYDGTIFHRVISNFMIQGGGLDKDLNERPTRAPIKNEADNGLTNSFASIAMARTNDPHSATAQFFINVTNNGFLNHTAPSMQGWGYAVFGKVVSGSDIVKKIEGVATGRKGFHDDVPKTDVVIEKAVAI